MSSTDVAALAGVFGLLGDLAVRWPLLVIGFWIALAAVPTRAFPEVAARNLPKIVPNNAPVVVTSGQSGGAQTRMTLRQTFSGRHSYRGRSPQTPTADRPRSMNSVMGQRRTQVSNTNGRE